MVQRMGQYRVGNHNPRNLYQVGVDRASDRHIGVMFTPEDAHLVRASLNRLLALDSRLARIAEGHPKDVTECGMTSGLCAECGQPWPCPTFVWATTERDYLTDPWNPADDGGALYNGDPSFDSACPDG